MYSDPLGTLIRRLRPMAEQGDVEFNAFLVELDEAREDRNDLLHALPVRDGLHRRVSRDLRHVRNFYDAQDLAVVTSSLAGAADTGNRLLYRDGGEAVRRWYQRG